MANIPNLPFSGADLHTVLTELNQQTGGEVVSVAWTDVTDKPATFPPATHTHAYADITGKPTSFAPSAHSHPISEVTGLQSALDGKQPTTSFKTVNGTAITGTGNITIPAGQDGEDAEIVSFATDAEAQAYSTANPGAAVFSTEEV